MALPYGAVVLEHFRRPRNRRSLEMPTAAHESFNPLCGDRVRIEVAVERDTIRDAAFTANACAICTASASMLTERATGMRVAEAAAIADDTIVAALETQIPPARLACAVLPLGALREALKQASQ